MAYRVRAIVVGPGYIGPVHVDALRRNGVDVVGLVGSGSDAGLTRAELLGVTAYASLTDALAAGPVDCVHIATPNYLHAPLAREAIEAGKHVVCEKPLAMDAAEGEELLALAEAAGVVHAVNFNFRFYALPRQAKAMVEAGELGPVSLIHGGYLQDWLLLPTDWNWRLDPDLGGGLRAVADIGSHWLDLMGFVTGPTAGRRLCPTWRPSSRSARSPGGRWRPSPARMPRRARDRRTRRTVRSGPRTTPACSSTGMAAPAAR
jgi:predicted dehydrogenase